MNRIMMDDLRTSHVDSLRQVNRPKKPKFRADICEKKVLNLMTSKLTRVIRVISLVQLQNLMRSLKPSTVPRSKYPQKPIWKRVEARLARFTVRKARAPKSRIKLKRRTFGCDIVNSDGLN